MNYKIIKAEPKGNKINYLSHPPEASTILFMTANPKNTQLLNINKEFNAVQEELESAEKEFRLRLRLDVNRDDLMEIFLRDKPSILHFSGHGLGEKGLVFQNEDGKGEVVATNTLTALIDEFSDALECIVLNACYSDQQAKAFAQHVPFVIGIDNAIGDTKAQAFSKAFYTCLFLGEGYESAFRKAVIQVGLENLGKGAQPVLYRWDPANAKALIEENSETKTTLETIGDDVKDIPKGFMKVQPAVCPTVSIFVPRSHTISQNDYNLYQSQDDKIFMQLIAGNGLKTTDEVINLFIQRFDVAIYGQEGKEEYVGDFLAKWIVVEMNEEQDYYYYLCGYVSPDGSTFGMLLGAPNNDEKSSKLLNQIYFSPQFIPSTKTTNVKHTINNREEVHHDGIPEGFMKVQPIVYPDISILVPKSHTISQNDNNLYQSEDDKTFMQLVNGNGLRTTNEVIYNLAQRFDIEAYLVEGVDGYIGDILSKWIAVKMREEGNYYYYLCGYVLPDGRAFGILLSGPNNDSNSHAITNKIFFSPQLL